MNPMCDAVPESSGRRQRAVAALVAAMAGLALAGPVGLVAGTLPYVASRLWAAHSRRSGVKRRADVMPEALESLADALRAKGSLRLAIEEISHRGPADVRSYFARARAQLDTGLDLMTAIDSIGKSADSPEARESALAMRLHIGLGGNLAESLELIAEQARHRLSVERELAAMTAQGRFSGLVMALAAPGFALVTHALGLGGGFLFRSIAGVALLTAGLALNVAGFLWIRRICTVKW